MCVFSIVIPCYRSGDWLDELVSRIEETMTSLSEKFEVILVNDASPDDTWSAITTLVERHPFLRGIDMLFNTGQNRATLCGLEHARGKWVIIMDDDLQHSPEEIPLLIDRIRQQPAVDCVMAKFEVKYHSLMRNLGSRFAARLFTHLYGKPPGIAASSFRILSRELVDAICQHRTATPLVGPLIYMSTQRIANVAVPHQPRQAKRSGYSFFGLVGLVAHNYLSVSTFPLRAISVLGLFSAAASLCLAVFYLVQYWSGNVTYPGFMTQVLLILFFGGMTLVGVGLIGEYLIQIMREVRQPPRYAIRTAVGLPDHDQPK
ncbi:MAG TPA: hypothetical protein DCY79_18325 [Planctomycetaceae bacterium]|nr:hypothetical protein [Blastopirellula sp.]HAY81765.1 hypothetical protein [Planctomycetaceae bacterium]